MRKIFILCVLSAAATMWNVSNAFAWSFPLTINPVGMIFCHDSDAPDSSAIDICKNYSNDITVPEYDTRYSRNEKFAYLKGKSPKVLIWFFASPPDTPSLTINATGNDSWNLADHEIWFNGSGFSIADSGNPTNYVSMHSQSSVPNSVGKHDKTWTWYVVEVGGEQLETPISVGTTNNLTYYTILATPQAPMTVPWTDVLDYACVWANGTTTGAGVVSGITSGAYNNSFKTYTEEGQYCLEATFTLTGFLAQQYTDCREISAVVQVFSNALGISSYNSPSIGVERIDSAEAIYQLFDGIYCKSICLIGNTNWTAGEENDWWNFHQLTIYNGNVYDACLKLNQSSPRIPMGENIQGNYKTDLWHESTNYINQEKNKWTLMGVYTIGSVQ
jgi:hypothetical protein